MHISVCRKAGCTLAAFGRFAPGHDAWMRLDRNNKIVDAITWLRLIVDRNVWDVWPEHREDVELHMKRAWRLGRATWAVDVGDGYVFWSSGWVNDDDELVILTSTDPARIMGRCPEDDTATLTAEPAVDPVWERLQHAYRRALAAQADFERQRAEWLAARETPAETRPALRVLEGGRQGGPASDALVAAASN